MYYYGREVLDFFVTDPDDSYPVIARYVDDLLNDHYGAEDIIISIEQHELE